MSSFPLLLQTPLLNVSRRPRPSAGREAPCVARRSVTKTLIAADTRSEGSTNSTPDL